jgi:hypothetical protein
VLALVFFCPLSFPTVSNAQTSTNKSQLLPYDDTDGYQVLSSIIDASTNKLKSDSVSIFHQTLSEEAFRGVRFQCASETGGLLCGLMISFGCVRSPIQ